MSFAVAASGGGGGSSYINTSYVNVITSYSGFYVPCGVLPEYGYAG